jgi:hypothetical protein
MIRFLLLLWITTSLFAFDTKLEVSLFTPDIKGTISNTQTSTDFNDHLAFDNGGYASYFALDIHHEITYLPNIKLSYFNMRENQATDLNRTIRIANQDFNSSVVSQVDFEVANAVLYKTLFLKGKEFSFLFWNPYSGDVAFDLGIDVKWLSWRYQISDVTTSPTRDAWINVNEFIPLAYFGIHYYLYNFSLHANSSFLGVRDAEALSYEVSVDYMVYKDFYLSAGYMYEYFTVQEKEDEIEFSTGGYKFGFKYVF